MSRTGRIVRGAVEALPSRRRARLQAATVAEAVMLTRMNILLDAVGRTPVGGGPDQVRTAVAELLADEDADLTWLTLAVLHAELPEPAMVVTLYRRIELHGAAAVLAEIAATAPARSLGQGVEVVGAEILVDVHQLLRTSFTTGIQRVTQETVRRWHRDHELTVLTWSDDFRAIHRAITDDAIRQIDGATSPTGARDAALGVLVPWQATYLVPELALDRPRTIRMQGIALHSRSRTAALAFDMVPVTAAETTDVGVPSDFSNQLAAVRHMDRVAAISGATAAEYEGWRVMTSAMGVTGPAIAAVPLPVEVGAVSAENLAEVRRRYVDPGLPLVLCVGSHEPRKNHLGVLQAAAILWRSGARFSLLFVGGNAWASVPFARRFTELVAAGHPVESVRGLPDHDLWALYRVARCTVFPSFSEGFGLPVAESLAAGTPAVTSRFGSMAEIAAGGGALVVDPRDDREIARALGELLTDDALHAELAAQALRRDPRHWDDYARETWDFLVDGRRPDGA